jgi:hypothetical protein
MEMLSLLHKSLVTHMDYFMSRNPATSGGVGANSGDSTTGCFQLSPMSPKAMQRAVVTLLNVPRLFEV